VMSRAAKVAAAYIAAALLMTTAGAHGVDDGGVIKLEVGGVPRGPEAALVREFIWSHWKNHRRGRIAVLMATYEGETGRSDFTVGPNDQRKWCVCSREYRDISPPQKGEADVNWVSCRLDREDSIDVLNAHLIDAKSSADRRAHFTIFRIEGSASEATVF
jgi:hypothetical protein